MAKPLTTELGYVCAWRFQRVSDQNCHPFSGTARVTYIHWTTFSSCQVKTNLNKQGKSRGGGRVRTTDFPISNHLSYLAPLNKFATEAYRVCFRGGGERVDQPTLNVTRAV
ncbi:hypothetical protein T265_05529 [Opisthorchis viverrini]|uniref:Uncharacterized protein n=1 Tax=Opisthorchis viverrini TaxID=6198 RepID=A0A074ZVL5_OPIVI|nr:hypothetical protein T265_05529 [Opisthorchis viverrini]KER27425.1 hypothetical protein T265_05529 [Opisthorchis viverrini]